MIVSNQDRLADITNIDEVVVGRPDSEIDIDMSADWSAFVNNLAAWSGGR